MSGELVLFNTRSRKKEIFKPINPTSVGLYLCGPTVYDFAHLGNARNVVVFDVLVRLLRNQYPKVMYVRNITDIDDKIIKKSVELNVDIGIITEKFTKHYQEDMSSLFAMAPDVEPKATDHIAEMIVITQRLLDKGHAYKSNGHILFNVASFPKHGILSKRQETLGVSRIENNDAKMAQEDFVLWKPIKSGHPGHKTPWGSMNCGWHIECSAMSWRYLGESFDIHGGGSDLIFPHHENEIAQSCCAFPGSAYANYFIHNEMILVNGQKMSKSLNNFKTVRDVLKVAPGEAVRYLILKTHYRSHLDYSDEALLGAKKELDRFYRALELHNGKLSRCDEPVEFIRCLNDDLNVPGAIAHLHAMADAALVGDVNAANALLASGKFIGLFNSTVDQWFRDGDVEWIERKIGERNAARLIKDFTASDSIRKELSDIGIVLEDKPEGTIWRKI